MEVGGSEGTVPSSISSRRSNAAAVAAAASSVGPFAFHNPNHHHASTSHHHHPASTSGFGAFLGPHHAAAAAAAAAQSCPPPTHSMWPPSPSPWFTMMPTLTDSENIVHNLTNPSNFDTNNPSASNLQSKLAYMAYNQS